MQANPSPERLVPMRIVLLAVVASSCTSEIRLGSALEPVDVPPDTGVPPEPPVSCLEAISDTVSLTFEPRSGCAFSADGNLERRNEFLQARADQARFVSLPDASQVCEIAMASGGARATFDDHLVVLVEDVVLVSGGSGGSLDGYPFRDRLPRFDWEAIRGRPFADRYTDYECLGGGRCVVPRTEELGSVDVQVDPDTMADIVEALDLTRGFDVRMVTFGDDDNGDCAHTGLSLDVTVRYVP